ncbi:MAG: hypothetical protein K0R66_1432 [Gammaproteobacteria bacterium]|nr:hypothetical protein [Gammaproteobacteria bacterium]
MYSYYAATATNVLYRAICKDGAPNSDYAACDDIWSELIKAAGLTEQPPSDNLNDTPYKVSGYICDNGSQNPKDPTQWMKAYNNGSAPSDEAIKATLKRFQNECNTEDKINAYLPLALLGVGILLFLITAAFVGSKYLDRNHGPRDYLRQPLASPGTSSQTAAEQGEHRTTDGAMNTARTGLGSPDGVRRRTPGATEGAARGF